MRMCLIDLLTQVFFLVELINARCLRVILVINCSVAADRIRQENVYVDKLMEKRNVKVNNEKYIIYNSYKNVRTKRQFDLNTTLLGLFKKNSS